MAPHRRSLLTPLQSRRLGTLPVLMEDALLAPPRPPEDPDYQPRMSPDNSASKRKRESQDLSLFDTSEAEIHTPKRARSRVGNTDEDATPAQQHSIRRKKGIRNLSNLNLRHASEEQQQLLHSPRESKFHEGSLTDKPSEAPPSVFTRVTQTESGSLVRMDELMSDYHGEGQAEQSLEDEHADTALDATSAPMSPSAATPSQGPGLFRFGRSIAANFHPLTLWNRIWNEQREELTRQNMLEAERKARLKTDAEARYAEMKKTGEFEFQPASAPMRSGETMSTPYDSAVSLESAMQPQRHKRIASAGSQLSADQGDTNPRDESDVPDTASKALRSIRSRLYLKRPSLSNLKNDLKRVRSDINIGSSAHRDTSSSASPVKADFGDPSLMRSHSKYDLKKQHKLSKRVSDLELKLRQARKELEAALAEASPAPKLGGKYERFTPTPTLKRPKFIPGKLPSLPSERILFPEQMEAEVGAATNAGARETGHDVNTRVSEEPDEETIKAPREKQYPARASTLFEAGTLQAETTSTSLEEHSEITQVNPINVDNMANDDEPTNTQVPAYSELDMKLKALDQSYKASRKSTTSKKRKSGGTHDDATFKLGRKDVDNDDDDAEWDEANQTPKKKRKSGPNKPKAAQGTATNSGINESKLPKPKKTKKAGKHAHHGESGAQSAAGNVEATVSGDEDAPRSSQFRNSLDSQGQQLEPLYEEEEETITVPLKDEPSKPTAKATPARYGRPRSLSPRKQAPSAEPGSEEIIISRAAGAAQRGRLGRVGSPPPGEHSAVMEVIDEAVVAVPGESDVPALPKDAARGDTRLAESRADGKEEKMDKAATRKTRTAGKEAFQWPDDVF